MKIKVIEKNNYHRHTYDRSPLRFDMITEALDKKEDDEPNKDENKCLFEGCKDLFPENKQKSQGEDERIMNKEQIQKIIGYIARIKARYSFDKVEPE